MIYRLVVNGRLPGLNEIIDASRANYRVGNALKQKTQEIVTWCIRQQLRGVKIEKPVILRYMFYEPNRRRDKDNIASGAHKIVQDALVKSGVLQNDGWRNISGFEDRFDVDKQNPRVEIEIEDLEE